MDTLPPELLARIVEYLPPSFFKTARLVSRSFNVTLAKKTFGPLASFLDPSVAHATLDAIMFDPALRPRVIWSPNCSCPKDLPIPKTFLMALHVGIRGVSWLDGRCDEDMGGGDGDGDRELMMVDQFLKKIGREDLSEQVLRDALFRYALYLTYTHDGKAGTPCIRMINGQLGLSKI